MTEKNYILKRTDSTHSDFASLVKKLDLYLAIQDGSEHAYYAQFNKSDTIKHTVVLLENDLPVGCGAIRPFNQDKMEVKRMFTLPHFRGKGIAPIILVELENWAKELGYKTCVLETGVRQVEAIRLYEKMGYQRIPNYGPYLGMENSICFEKILP